MSARLACCLFIALGKDPASPWRKGKAKGACQEVVELASELCQGTRDLAKGNGMRSLAGLDNAC